MEHDEFITRTYGGYNDSSLNGIHYSIPKCCPICGIANAPVRNSHTSISYTQSLTLQIFNWKCTNCGNKYVTGHTRESWADKNLKFLFIFPSSQPRSFSEKISTLSPRFIQIYKEAYYSEIAGHLSSAGIAYRLALEILIKDYAIVELHKEEKEVVDKKLYAAIENYLPDVNFQKVADVIRLKGNDYTHFKEKYDQVDFTMFKDYLNIFIDLIEVQLKINHPPIGHRE